MCYRWWWTVTSVRPVTLLFSVRSLLLTPVCWASWSERPVTFLRRLVQRPVTSVSSFLRDLAYGLVPIFMLGLAWYLGSSLVLLRSCLWCWSSDYHVAFVQVTSCTLLNNKTITCKFIRPIWLCWSSNTKIQSEWAKGPFSLHKCSQNTLTMPDFFGKIWNKHISNDS